MNVRTKEPTDNMVQCPSCRGTGESVRQYECVEGKKTYRGWEYSLCKFCNGVGGVSDDRCNAFYDQRSEPLTRKQETLLLTVARVLRAKIRNEIYAEQEDDLWALNEALEPFGPTSEDIIFNPAKKRRRRARKIAKGVAE